MKLSREEKEGKSMAFGSIDYRQQAWVKELGDYLRAMKDEYLYIGKSCMTAVSNPILICDAAKRMSERDGNMLYGFFDDMTTLLHDNAHMLANTELGSYVSSEDGYIEDDDCYNLLARTALSAADIENGFDAPKSELVHWMRFVFMS